MTIRLKLAIQVGAALSIAQALAPEACRASETLSPAISFFGSSSNAEVAS